MRGGQTDARIGLAAVGDDAIAVGALTGLEGEITILDGAVWVARPDGKDINVSGPIASPDDQATLLTLANVRQWDRVELEMNGTATGSELDRLIERTAREHGIDASRPFPFVIEGVAAQVDIHVINGYCLHAPQPMEADMKPWRWSIEAPTAVRIVGFYAADSAGVLTHHGTAIHVHVLVERDGRTITGHIDGVTLQPGATVLLPSARSHAGGSN